MAPRSALLLAMILGSCTNDPAATASQCSSADDCPSGFLCHEGECALACNNTLDCRQDLACINGVCQRPEAGECPCCDYADDCPPSFGHPAICIDTSDQTDCQGERVDAVCNDHVCASEVVDDDSACAGRTRVCPGGAEVIPCTGASDQPPPTCAPSCDTTSDCPLGSSCTNDGQCANGHCVSGVCCDAACDGLCQACRATLTGAADGTCAPIVAHGVDLTAPSLCTASGDGCVSASCACDGYGACRVANGVSCDSGDDCASNTCECFNASCTDQRCRESPCGTCSYALNASACAAGLGAPDPVEDSGCAGVHSCFAGECRLVDGQPCSTNAECGHTCIGNECAPWSAPGEACDENDDADCIAGLSCHDTDVCIGEDLCAVDNGGCSPDATCTPTGVGVNCVCKNGFVGDGITCTPECNAPAPFSFSALVNQPLSQVDTRSNVVQIAGGVGCSYTVSVSGDGSAEYRVCGTSACPANPPFTSNVGAISSGQWLQARLITASTPATTVTATVTARGTSATFSVTTTSPKRVFVTSSSFSGDLGGLDAADALCQSHAASLGGTWRAWLSDDGQSADERLFHSTLGYRRVDGVEVAGDWNDLVDGEFDVIMDTESSTGSLPGARGIEVVGDFAYVAVGYGDALAIFDVSASVPAPMGSTGSDYRLYEARKLVVRDGFAYVAAQRADALTVVDVQSPTNPTVVGTTGNDSRLDAIFDVAVGDGFVYAAVYNQRSLAVIDVGNPNNPTILGTTPSTGSMTAARGVCLLGNHAFVSASGGGLTVVDITEPTNPTVLTSVSIPNAHGSDIAGELVYVATGSSRGLVIVDVSVPTAPVIIGSVVAITNAEAYDVSVSGPLAYVADQAGAIVAVDVGDPRDPQVVASAGDSGMDGARYLTAVGDRVFVGSQDTNSMWTLEATVPTIRLDENGALAFGPVWTGTAPSGNASGGSCESWVNGAVLGTVGSAGAARQGWTEAGEADCGEPARLYCFEQ